jgi:hypothetical protein
MPHFACERPLIPGHGPESQCAVASGDLLNAGPRCTVRLSCFVMPLCVRRLFSSAPGRSLLAICCAIHLAGCVAIPIPTALPDPEPFTAERMTPIRIGQTTRDEVRALFAEWTYETDQGTQTAHIEPQIAEGGRSWVFGLSRQLGDIRWAGVFLHPEAPAPIPFFSGKVDNHEDFWVLFDFNDDATVARLWITSDKTPCAVGGACYSGGYLHVIADQAISAGANTGKSAGDRCAVYAYADDDFEMPVVVTDGTHTGRLIAKTSFVRFDVATGPTTPSAWYENIPGSAITAPINCAGGEDHYVALRPNEGLIEVKPVTPSTGERAIKKRYLVERLIAAQPSVAAESPGTILTQCTAADPCHEITVFVSGYADVSLMVNEEELFPERPHGKFHFLLRPGRYTLSSRVYSIYAPQRVDTFDLKAGHRYQMKTRNVYCRGLIAPFSDKQAKAQVCKEFGGESGDTVSVRTNWFEDAATKRVVAGQKWCADDTECPGSKCSKPAGQTRGICDIPELQCTYGERCVPR